MSCGSMTISFTTVDPASLAYNAYQLIIRVWEQIVSKVSLFILSFAGIAPSETSRDGITDAVYVQRTRSGDNEAFEQLVYRYQDMIYNLCLRMLGSRADGEDAAQETFVKAYEGVADFKDESAFSTWLFRIATNICRNRQTSFWGRLSKKAVRLDRTTEDDEGNTRQWELPSSGETPEDTLERKRTAQSVRDALAKLPAKHREIIVLADIQDKSYEEIGTITGMALGTIKSRLARGRDALKRMLAG